MERGWWLGDGLPRQCGQCRCTAGAAGYPQQHPGWRALAMRGWRAAQGMRSESRPSRLAMESRWRSAGGAYIDRSTAEWDRWALTRRLRGYPDPSSLRWLVGGAESAAPLGAHYVALRAARRGDAMLASPSSCAECAGAARCACTAGRARERGPAQQKLRTLLARQPISEPPVLDGRVDDSRSCSHDGSAARTGGQLKRRQQQLRQQRRRRHARWARG